MGWRRNVGRGQQWIGSITCVCGCAQQTTLTQHDALRRIVLEHLLDQIEQLQVVLLLRLQVPHQWLAVIAHIVAGRRLLVPVQLAVVEVLGFRFAVKSMNAVVVNRMEGGGGGKEMFVVPCGFCNTSNDSKYV